MHDHYAIVFEAEWALTNITSTSFAGAVVQSGAVEPLIKNLYYNNPSVQLQAAWCLGNIAGDCNNYRDLLLSTPHMVDGL
jgi:importin subunit alpha-1